MPIGPIASPTGSSTMLITLCLLIGVVAGLRAMTAPAAVAWAAAAGSPDLSASWLAFLGFRFTPWIVTLLAVGELVTDQLPSTPSRKVPVQFGTRILMGAVCGAALAIPDDMLIVGALAGAIGAVLGTLGGAAARAKLAAAFGSDRPAALIEDLVAIVGAAAIVCAV
jgi:uncharacterized membrane protein